MRVLEVMHDKTTRTMQQCIGTNHKSLQVHENNPKSLQKQHKHGYKTQKLHKHGYKSQHNIKKQHRHRPFLSPILQQ